MSVGIFIVRQFVNFIARIRKIISDAVIVIPVKNSSFVFTLNTADDEK